MFGELFFRALIYEGNKSNLGTWEDESDRKEKCAV